MTESANMSPVNLEVVALRRLVVNVFLGFERAARQGVAFLRLFIHIGAEIAPKPRRHDVIKFVWALCGFARLVGAAPPTFVVDESLCCDVALTGKLPMFLRGIDILC